MTSEQRKQVELLYLNMYDLLFSYALSVQKNESLAEEAVQETFRTACKKPDSLVSSPNPKGWLVNVLKYTLANQKRSQDAAARVLAAYMAAQDPFLIGSDEKLRLELLYGNLSGSEEFQLLKEMAIEGRSHLEMAEKRGITVSACKKRVERAKKYLKKRIW